jgi:hypothetical protein
VTAWLFLNSLGLTVVGIVLYLLLRQMGYVLRRVGPSGARATPEGPRAGENLAYYMPEIAAGRLREKAKLIVFVSEACSICAEVKRGAVDLARAWHEDATILLVYDCVDEASDTHWKEITRGLLFRHACHLRRQLGVSFVPFGIATDEMGTVVTKGLVNEIGHLESLLEGQRSSQRGGVSGESAKVSV